MKNQSSLRIVIKLGTTSIVDEKTQEPMLSTLSNIVSTAVNLRKAGHKVIIVSSGAVGVGLRRMNIAERPKHSARVQALAAIGQCRLMTLWDQLFELFSQPIAQVLLTRKDIADRHQYLNAQNTFRELLEMGIIPIVNENDTIAVSEIKFGDNDTLSAITAAMVNAQYLFLMTDVDGLYDKNPRTHPNAKVIEVVDDISTLQVDVSSAGSSLGVGGMSTKIVAARLATSVGVTTVIARSSSPGNIIKIVDHVENLNSVNVTQEVCPSIRIKESINQDDKDQKDSPSAPKAEIRDVSPLHTRFIASQNPIRDRHFWILYGLSPRGTVYIDAGAYRALENKSGLFAAGVVNVKGNFAQLEAVRIVVVDRSVKDMPMQRSGSPELCGTEVGRALVNYGATEISRIKGVSSNEIQNILGYADSEYVALRENISLSQIPSSPLEEP